MGARDERAHGLLVGLDVGLVEDGPHVDRVGVGHRLHEQHAVVVGERHGERAAPRQAAGDVQAFGRQELRAEAQARGTVVVAGDEHDRHAEAAHDAFEDVVQQLDCFGGRETCEEKRKPPLQLPNPAMAAAGMARTRNTACKLLLRNFFMAYSPTSLRTPYCKVRRMLAVASIILLGWCREGRTDAGFQ